MKANLYTDAAMFQKWFVGVIDTMPIISSYCLAMPMTGSYLSFLSAVSEKGEPLKDEELKKNKDLFETVKNNAMTFIQQHSVKLSSSDPMVQHSLRVAQGE